MAGQLTWNGTGATNSNSESFTPRASFILTIHGTLDSNVEYTIQMKPKNSTGWRVASGTGNPISAVTTVAKLDAPFGYEFRVVQTGTGTQADTNPVAIHFGEITTVEFFNAGGY